MYVMNPLAWVVGLSLTGMIIGYLFGYAAR